MDLRANTAVDVLIGPFVDSTDGNTTEDGLTISQGDVKLSKNGQSLTQKNDNTACAFDDDGYYNCELDTTDTNTEGNLVLIVHESGALPVRHEYNVMAEAAWDSLYVAKDDGFMDVNIKTIGRADTQETEANNLESACSNYSVTRGLTGTAVPAAAADAAGGLMISDDGGWDADELYDAIITDAAGANIAIDIIAVKAETADILADTDDIGVAGAGLSAIPWNASWDAEVQSECTDALNAYDPPTRAELTTDTNSIITEVDANETKIDALNDVSTADLASALTDIHLDHLLAATYDPASKPGAADALLNEIIENDGGVSRFTENSLEQAPSGTGASAATIADAVWDEAQADHVGAGTFGVVASEVADILVDTGTTLPATLTTIDNLVDDLETRVPDTISLANINAEVDTAIETYHLDHLLAATYDPSSKPGAADALLNEIIENDGGVSRFTENSLEQAPSGTGASAATIADAVWDEAQADHVGAGTFGVVASEVADILTDTGTTLPTAIADVPTVAEFNARSLVAADYTIVADLGVVQTADHTAGIADIPTVAEFNARSLVAADYTIVADLGVVQTADHTAGIADIPTVAEFNARTIASADYFDPAADTVATVTDVTNQVSADVTAISGSSEAANNLEASAETIVVGTVSHDNTAASTTVFYSDDLTEATADHYNGRIVIFTSGALQDQATDITDYELDTGEGKFTVTALTEAPADNVTFIIV